MMPVGPLMIEHRLIERMVALMVAEKEKIDAHIPPDAEFILTAVDFIKSYADQLHHGKEEAILFRELMKKELSAEHETIFYELIEEHRIGREYTRKLAEGHFQLVRGEEKAGEEISNALRNLVAFYPGHIAKEDKNFFLPVMDYFDEEEKSRLTEEFYNFDRRFVHNKYHSLVAAFDGKKKEVRI